MIRFEGRFDEYSYRVATMPLHETCTEVEEGQFVTIKEGKLALAGADSVKSFIAIGSKRAGRNQVAGKACGNISFLHGNFILSVDQFDKSGTYLDDMTPLAVADGILTPATEANATVVAHAIGAPKNGFLKIIV